VAIETTRRQLLIPSLALCATACRHAARDLADYTEEEPPRLSSSISTADPRLTSQLLSGWHQVEQNAWRWTARNFAVVLRSPPGCASRGAALQLRLVVPDIVISRLQSVTISASIQDTRLAPETYRRRGPATYIRDVSPRVLSGNSVQVDFALDRAISPNQVDGRELGVIVERVSLETK